MAEAPRASAQHEHEWAVALADEVIAEAASRGVLVAVAIVDHRGDPIQQDVMDDAPTFAAFASLALAATAATFQTASEELPARSGSHDALRQLAATLPFAILTTPGGVPIVEGGRCVAGLGVAGPTPELSADIATAVVARHS